MSAREIEPLHRNPHKRDRLRKLFHPENSIPEWQKKYPDISPHHITTALKLVETFIDATPIPPKIKDCRHLLFVELDAYRKQKRKIVERIRTDQEFIDELHKKYKDIDISFPGAVDWIRTYTALEIENAMQTYITSSTGISRIEAKLLDQRSYIQKPEERHELHEQTDESEKMDLQKLLHEMRTSPFFLVPLVTLIGSDGYAKLIIDANPPRTTEGMYVPLALWNAFLALLIVWAIKRSISNTRDGF